MKTPAEKPTFTRDSRLFVLFGITGIVLLFMLWDEKSELNDFKNKIRVFEEKLIQTKNTIKDNYKILLPPKEKIRNPKLLSEKSLRTVVEEATEKVGISRYLMSIDPSEDNKKQLLKARVSLSNVGIRKLVEFIVFLKNLSAGIRDTQATMRMQSYNADRWKLDITLEAPMGVQVKQNNVSTK